MSWEPEEKNTSFSCPYCEIFLGKQGNIEKREDGTFWCTICGRHYNDRAEANKFREDWNKEKA